MKIKTVSGSTYIIEDGTLTRLSEEPIFSYRKWAPDPSLIIDHIKIEDMDTPTVGQRCLFILNNGPLNISEIVEIEND